MDRRASFTLIELLIVIIVLAILTAIGMPIYTNSIEKTKLEICAANEEALLEAVKIYDMKNDVMPGDLAKAWNNYGDEAMAIVWERKKSEHNYIYLAYISFQSFKYFLADMFSINKAYGVGPDFSHDIADKKILKCPSDPNPWNGAGQYSYGLNDKFKTGRWADVTASTVVIADCDQSLFKDENTFANRHKRGAKTGALSISKEGGIFFRDKDDRNYEPVNDKGARMPNVKT